MKIVLNHKETEDILTAALDYATYLGDQMREFDSESQIVEEIEKARGEVLAVRSKMFSEGKEISLAEREADILRKICLRSLQKYYDKVAEYRIFPGVFKAFEKAGGRYSDLMQKLTIEE